ncbi:peroxiredoxin [Gloeomargarita lithophora Alchichica-D10]|uniref:Peroxiredoxin n=1 Tax=Gloeomargarita lithophora Alchichica-D10 TaxID=1188229 RepID=A0A1J0AB88_9CYAN|nr:thioredoxin family protein [Gloeomargarita lithophora]APB33200.1 peroxiredoxin [Gloeomargarita lithophora Alchichica-D10]
MARFAWLVPATAAVVVTGIAVSTLTVNTSAAVRVGNPAPDFTAKTSTGQTVRLSDHKGKVVVLEWTNHECPFVVKHYGTGNMQKLQQEAKAKGVVWLSVVSSAPGQQGFVTADQANGVVKDKKATPTAVLLDPDGSLGKMYNARTTPHMFVIDKSGKLQYMGAIDDAPSLADQDVSKANNYVRTALGQVMVGQPVTTSTTQPYGCSVKYKN